MTRRLLLGATLAVAVAAMSVGSCAGGARPVSAPVPTPARSDVVWTILLAGDAGAPTDDDPVLGTLSAAAAEAPDRTTVVFLGDNIYPAGLPDSASPDRAEAERRLLRQVEAVTRVGARAVFVPGNHDWAHHAPDGWASVRRAEGFIAAHGGGLAEQLPGDGCPGPAVRDLGTIFRLVLLDTQWWLHEHERPRHPASPCPADREDEVETALAEAVRTADRRHVVVAAHHPLRSGGQHGGRWNLGHHLFPLREVKSWLWVPLPVLGSLYPFARSNGITRQDVSNRRNREMREAIERGMLAAPPLVYAAGHEHTLQVIEGESARWLLVSGTGYYGHTTPVGWLDRTRFAAAASGFMRLDALADGRVRLGVMVVAGDGSVREAWSGWLR